MTTTTISVPETVADSLARDKVIWLTTVNSSEAPVPTPVWFLWADGKVLIFSQPNAAKIGNLTANPHAALNLNSDAGGGHVVVFKGVADLERTVDEATWQAYVDKYRDDIAGLNYTPERFRTDYSHPVWIEPTSLRSW
ncbi:TIGR03667 family PPOX class F420-dependent oxidoreductase [Gordonia sp. CPCC 206044]|uniref:TIGR03667 family PPOX class F420-dependent oxidoreductase n=1 Tax=Gordonia sp. CPCC 206044 TaxID=3140793 RepID=UPI003AF381C4